MILKNIFSFLLRLLNFPLIASFVLLSVTPFVTAASAFDPDNIDTLPPGLVKEKILALPAHKQKQCIERLNELGLPASDFDDIDMDKGGEFFYKEQAAPLPMQLDVSESSDSELNDLESGELESKKALRLGFGISLSDAFNLHSNPGAPNVIYLDFNGHQISDTVWNTDGDYDALPYDIDGNLYSFSNKELDNIANIWHRVAEDFKPFNVDVTTEQPSQFNERTARVLITKKKDGKGKALPFSGYGGIAYIGVWGGKNFSYYQPALVYYDNLASAPQYIAESASHEVAHNFGLSHDGSSSASYYSGSGNGFIKWAPIMGQSHNAQVTQWSKGEYSGANNKQDDISILAGKLGYRSDDHSNSIVGATPLDVDNNGVIATTTPETDPYNYQFRNKGIIHTSNDKDFFQVASGSGQLRITVTPGWKAYRMDQYRGANLDVELSLYDTAGRLLQTVNPTNDTNATLSRIVSAGTYFVSVSGVGSSNFSQYASIGQYFISGQVPAGRDEPNSPPVAKDDSVTVQSGQSIRVAVLVNDRDAEGDVLSIDDASVPRHGTISINSNKTITYTSNKNYSGADQFNYWITDGNEGRSMATVRLTVTSRPADPVDNTNNKRPVAVSDAVTVIENSVTRLSPLQNDSDPNRDAIKIIDFRPPLHGTATMNSDQTLTYKPTANYVGNDRIDYWLSDGNLYSSMATISITISQSATDSDDAQVVNPPQKNIRPTAVNDSVVVSSNQSSTLNLLSNDEDPNGDTLTIASFRQPLHGKATLNANQTITYIPNSNFVGTDEIDYWLSDGTLYSSMATAKIRVEASVAANNPDGLNKRPVANGESVVVARNQTIVLNPLANDKDPNGDKMTIIDFRQPKHGVAKLNSNQTISYTPNRNYAGSDRLDYWISDGELVSSMAITSITVGASGAPQFEIESNKTLGSHDEANNRPIAYADSVTVSRNGTLSIDVLANDKDAENDALSVIDFRDAVRGSVTLNEDQTMTYVPPRDFSGKDRIEYWATDGDGVSSMAVVTITVR